MPSRPLPESLYLHAAAALCGLLVATCAHAGNPGYDRPGLGFTPAVLQAGDVTYEQGLPDWSRADGVSLYTADALLRVGVGGPFELQLGSSYNHLSAPGSSADGRGGSSLGLKFALPASGNFSWGLLGSVTFTDGAPAFRNDAPEYLLGAAFNWQLDARNSAGAYVEADHGADDGGLVAFNASHAFSDALAAYAEAGWQHFNGAGSGSMAGAGVTWMATPRVQLDASFRHRLGGSADDWDAGLGVAVYFGRL
ncbi:MAG TPA: transporter [Rhodanobacteraceae bacterium]|nr:transporter [Rhodanobacteraceae bacterium]